MTRGRGPDVRRGLFPRAVARTTRPLLLLRSSSFAAPSSLLLLRYSFFARLGCTRFGSPGIFGYSGG